MEDRKGLLRIVCAIGLIASIVVFVPLSLLALFAGGPASLAENPIGVIGNVVGALLLFAWALSIPVHILGWFVVFGEYATDGSDKRRRTGG
ncbi:hypothetical protein CLV63_113120 [Murinocardiopsis flavida]|uniref:Uncharacterized protein n=1 Tax=Murinocardiopsis flavida TaxID=645275 RepID=A0A2P8DFI3_9ACTN|nr:hypothetical protein [Murinocardiopsis flavida]PSK95957.1 hypothetical protein CLV63_113120 [Murinocardiopsis flavida]